MPNERRDRSAIQIHAARARPVLRFHSRSKLTTFVVRPIVSQINALAFQTTRHIIFFLVDLLGFGVCFLVLEWLFPLRKTTPVLHSLSTIVVMHPLLSFLVVLLIGLPNSTTERLANQSVLLSGWKLKRSFD